MKRLANLFAVVLSCGLCSGFNYVHNSSFEVGASGWTVWGSFSGDPFGNEAPVAEHVIATNALHGGKSLWWRTRAFSRPFWLTNGTYTITFGAYSSSGVSFTNTVIPNWFVAGAASDLTIPASTMSCTPLTSGWKRFTNTFTVSTNWWYLAKFFCNNAVTKTWVDEIQVQPGGTATAWEPAAPIEVGMDTADPGNNLFLADAKTLRFNLWNHGVQTNVTIRYDVIHGIWNSNITYGTISTNALAAGTNTTINFTLPALWGDQRITCYITNLNATWDETSVALLPYAPQSGRDTNGLLGIHAQYSPYHLTHARKIGFAWNRVFSPMTDTRWVNVFPTLTSTSLFSATIWDSDWQFLYSATNDLVPFVVLAGEDNGWYPQTNASLDVMIGDATNYVGRVVHRYKDPPYNVKHWEVWNEPQQNPRTTIALYDPTIYANLYTNIARLIKLIDPTATVIAFGGYGQASEALDAWNAFTAIGKADADILAFHLYPQPANPFDPNLKEDYRDFSTAHYEPIIDAFGTVRHLWNTETATRDVGGYHTIQVAFAYPFYWGNVSHDPWTSEAWFNELDVRQLPAVDRQLYNFCRTVGWGMEQFNIQNGRMVDDTIFDSSGDAAGNHPTIYEINGTLKPWAVALVIANHFVKTPGLGRATNAANRYVEAYLHTNTLGVVMPIFNCDRANATLTWTNPPAAVAYYDTMGNLISTNSTSITVTRSVHYLVSGTLSAAQMSNMVRSASWSTNEDTTPPSLTIDFSPIGESVVWGGVTNAFKATAIDATSLAYADASTQVNATNVMYRWSLNGGSTWSPWGQTNHFYHSFSASDMYDVRWQAKDKANNMTPEVKGPYFGALEELTPPPAPPAQLNVSATANIGTITVP